MLAPEPRDVVWPNVTLTFRTRQIREAIVFAFLVLLFMFWIIPVSGLATLLSYQEIQKMAPWLARLIDKNDTIRAIVQNSLPSVAMVIMNALLPFLLEGMCHLFLAVLCVLNVSALDSPVSTCRIIISSGASSEELD